MPDLGMQVLQVHLGLCLTSPKGDGCIGQQLVLPVRDLVLVHIVLLGQLRKGLVTLDAASATLALKAGEWVRRGRLLIRLLSCSPARAAQGAV